MACGDATPRRTAAPSAEIEFHRDRPTAGSPAAAISIGTSQSAMAPANAAGVTTQCYPPVTAGNVQPVRLA